MDDEAPMLVTTNGLVIPVRAVSYTLVDMAKAAIEKEWRARGEPLDPPMYTVTTVAGLDEVFAHDATTLDVTPKQTGLDDPAEAEEVAVARSTANWAAWKAYQDARARLLAAQNAKGMRIWLRGLEVEETEGWAERQAEIGVEVPTDPLERRYHYLMTEVLVTPEDLFQAIQKLTALSYRGMVKEEDIASAVSSFRDSLQRKAPRGPADRERTVAVQRPVGDAEGGEGMAHDTQPVAQPAGGGPGGDDGGAPGPATDGGG